MGNEGKTVQYGAMLLGSLLTKVSLVYCAARVADEFILANAGYIVWVVAWFILGSGFQAGIKEYEGQDQA